MAPELSILHLSLRDCAWVLYAQARSSAGEHFPDTEGVGGSIPPVPTSFFAKFGQFHSFIARGGFSPPRRIRFDARLDER
jgi:hypothetical protein